MERRCIVGHGGTDVVNRHAVYGFPMEVTIEEDFCQSLDDLPLAVAGVRVVDGIGHLIEDGKGGVVLRLGREGATKEVTGCEFQRQRVAQAQCHATVQLLEGGLHLEELLVDGIGAACLFAIKATDAAAFVIAGEQQGYLVAQGGLDDVLPGEDAASEKHFET